MVDSLDYGPTPCEEECQQFGMPSYEPQKAREECKRFIELIRTCFGREPEGATLYVKSNPYEDGHYYDVECRFYENNERANAYAYAIDADPPMTWNDTRKRDWARAAGLDVADTMTVGVLSQ